jgi:cellulose synthase operon protein C
MRINFRFLFLFLGICLILTTTVVGLHWYQSKRQYDELLRQARHAEVEHRSEDALRLYGRYLSSYPNDIDARFEVGQLLVGMRDYGGALPHFEAALRLNPQLHAARRDLAEISLALRRFADARTHLADHLLVASPDDPELHSLLAKCESELGSYEQAHQHFEKAKELAPAEPRYALELASLLTKRFNNLDRARNILDELVAADPTNASSYIARGEWLRDQASKTKSDKEVGATQSQLLSAAWHDVQQALALEPTSPQVALFAARTALATNKVAEVRNLVSAAIAANPTVPALYGSSAQLELHEKNRDGAIDILKQGLKANPGNLDLIWNLAQLEMDAGNTERVEGLVSELKLRGYPNAPVQYLQARLLFERGDWRAAVQLLESSRSLIDRNHELVKEIDLLLSACYRRTGNAEQELVGLRRAVANDPLWAPSREALADALLRAGRRQEALTEYWQIAVLPSPPTSALLSLGRMLLVDGLHAGVDTYDWSSFEEVVSALEKNESSLDEAAVLRAELMVAREQFPEAEKLLRDRISAVDTAERNQVPLPQYALISLFVRTQNWEAVDQAIQDTQKSLGDTVQLRLEQARYLIQRHGDQLDLAELEKLAEPAPHWTDAETSQIATALSSYFVSIQQDERAERLASEIATSNAGEQNISLHLLLLDIAARKNDTALMNRTLTRIKQIEGEGPMWRLGEASRLTIEAKETANEALFTEAFKHLSEAAVLRPNWSRIAAAKAQIYDAQNLDAQAVDEYLKAINLGERSPQLVSRTIMKLFQSGRYLEVDSVIRKLQEQQTPFSFQLMKVASEVSLQLEHYDRALALAKDWAADSDTPEEHLWLAHVYSITGDAEGALAAYEKAISLAPNSPSGWVALVQWHARNGDGAAAENAIHRAKQKMDPDKSLMALAQCYEAVNDFAQAKANYSAAVKKSPKDAALLQRVADFHLRTGTPNEAKPYLESLIASEGKATEPDRLWARRNLALILGASGVESEHRRAQELVEANLLKSKGALEDRRTKAILLASRTERKSLDEGINLLENVIREQSDFSLSDNFVLAELYKRIQDWGRYSRTMRGVLANGGARDSRYLRSHANTLISRGETDEAQLWLARLKEIAPQELETASIEAKLIFQSKDYKRLLSLLEQKSENDEALTWTVAIAEEAALTLLRNKQENEARPFIELATRLHARDPDDKAGIAVFYARQGDIDKALQSLSANAARVPKELALVIKAALQSSKLSDASVTTLLSTAKATLTLNPADVELQLALGDLLSWAGRWQEALAIYREVLQTEPNNIIALNNLAMVLALSRRELDTALKAVEQAILYFGPRDFLLDTRGVVLLASGKAEAALFDFERSAETRTNADLHFHIAQALYSLKRFEEAKSALTRARAGGVDANTVHPLERPQFEQLTATLSKPEAIN